jgi:hypothetical protein
VLAAPVLITTGAADDALAQFPTEQIGRVADRPPAPSIFAYVPAPRMPPMETPMERRRIWRLPLAGRLTLSFRATALACAVPVFFFSQIGDLKPVPVTAGLTRSVDATSSEAMRSITREEPAVAATAPSTGAVPAVERSDAIAAPTTKTAKAKHAPTRTRRPPIASDWVGSLLVESEPNGGQVFLNQAPVGMTPLLLPHVKARAYALRIDVAGYSRWSRGIYIRADEKTAILAQLDREQR